MKRRLQFGGLLLALGISAGLGLPSNAQNRDKPPKQDRPPQRQAPPAQQRPQQRPPQQDARRGQNDRGNSDRPNTGRGNADRANAERARNSAPPPYRPNNLAPNRPPDRPENSRTQEYRPPVAVGDAAQRPNYNPNRPPNATIHPRDLTTEQRQNLQKLDRLPPQQRQEMQKRAEVWNRLTPDQRQHLKYDVVPQWQQLPPDSQRAIRQRLGVLQNMPESARNQHLNDPNFTRGMSEEDKAMLRDLSHMHVGAPDHPNE